MLLSCLGFKNLLYRCLQTTMFAMEGVKVPPENWTISCAVSEVCVPPIVFDIM